MRLSKLHSAGLLALGFIGGLVGVSVATDMQPFGDATRSHVARAPINACTPAEQEDDIFFLSCGGIF